jgi:hypothetical protein
MLGIEVAAKASLPTFVVTKRDEGWQIEGLLNTRKLTLECQFFLDDFDSLSAEAQRQVTDLVSGFKQRHQADQSKEM